MLRASESLWLKSSIFSRTDSEAHALSPALNHFTIERFIADSVVAISINLVELKIGLELKLKCGCYNRLAKLQTTPYLVH